MITIHQVGHLNNSGGSHCDPRVSGLPFRMFTMIINKVWLYMYMLTKTFYVYVWVNLIDPFGDIECSQPSSFLPQTKQANRENLLKVRFKGYNEQVGISEI